MRASKRRRLVTSPLPILVGDEHSFFHYSGSVHFSGYWHYY